MTGRSIPAAVRRQQTEASDPLAAVFVSANAGAGKTHVLAQRVIRLMLEGVDPAKILCITFTKAAAANMAMRVYDRLKAWVLLGDDALGTALGELGVTAIDAAVRRRARLLFAAALETPGGLNVQTIHAFCTRVLRQFPFEADVAAHFSVLEDRARNEMLGRARMTVLLDAAAAPGTPLGHALRTVAAAATDTTLVAVVNDAVAARARFAAWAGDGREAAVATLSAALGVARDEDLAQVDREIVEGPFVPVSRWADAAAVLGTGAARDADQAARLRAALAADGEERVERYLGVFFKDGDGEPRRRLITRSLAAADAALLERLEAEQERLAGLRPRRRAIRCRDRTAALATIAVEVMGRYTREKERRGLLDYDDLIDKTHRLLTHCDAAWVHHKLDLGFDHVLIDEAQDTSERQWDIVKRLVSEFGAGEGVRGARPRTVFAVGDEKQSIFSFQGAAPREYDAARRHFERAFARSNVAWRFVRFDHSFRSGENVLGAVDAVFRDPAVYRSITSDRGNPPVHRALPDAAPGLVEIWPLVEPDPEPETTAWEAPFDDVSQTSPQIRLAGRIAGAVRDLIGGGTTVGIERRRLRCGDILILVRQRGPLFGAVIRALKNADIAVAGADRLVLTEHIAVGDLLALADALLLEQDDLALAVALKSPLFGLDDDLLFDLAHGRRGSLRTALRARAAEREAFAAADELLSRCVERARHDGPFAFFAWLLGPQQGRRKIFARLGLEAADALGEFLELALAYEALETPSLQGFVAWLRSAATEVKRDMETTRDEVRVMTVHGAKGLEAPVVILADTTTAPRGSHPPTLIDIPVDAAPEPGRVTVWAPRRGDDVAAVARAREALLDEHEDEYRRLLYVAMTRAAERLIVCGCKGRNALHAGCWYELIRSGLRGEEGAGETGEGEGRVLRYRRRPPASRPGADPPRAAGAQEAGGRQLDEREAREEAPAWLTQKAAAAAGLTRVRPSAAGGGTPPRRRAGGPARPGGAGAGISAQARGTLIHRLLQSLPDIEPERREAAASAYLARAAAQLGTADGRELAMREIAGHALAILAAPAFAALFSPGSRAEVPIVGRLGRGSCGTLAVSGQIDRLAVTADAVLIADYKTDRDPPSSAADAAASHPHYVGQLALYRALLRKIHPDRPVRAALVWTEIPALMAFPADCLDEALARITAP